MQNVPNADFDIEAKFTSVVNSPYQMQGILIEQDAQNYIRFDILQANCMFAVFVASFTGGNPTVIVNNQVRNGPANYFRVKRSGNVWTLAYSYDGLHWTPPFTFSRALSLTKLGAFVGNNSYNGSPAPAFSAKLDYFVNRASPPSLVNGNPYPPAPGPPVLDIWYGSTQNFGQNGVPQEWINILGTVSDPDAISSLTYSVNTGAAQQLWMGENPVRLVEPGDFNVEIPYASLRTGANTVVITATDFAGQQRSQTVNVNYTAGQTWPATYNITWSPTTNIQSVAQIVDGKWQVQSNGTVRTQTMGYDRLITLGDRATWRDYEVVADITINALSCRDFGVGIVAGWQGHTTLQYGTPLPDQPRTGHPFPGLGWYSKEPDTGSRVNIYTNTATVIETPLIEETTGRQLTIGVTYTYKFRVQRNASGGSHYSLKIWPAASAEPSAWDLQADGEPSQGSIVLGAHWADVSIGRVRVSGL